MADRTTESIVTFQRAFSLSAIEGSLPAGRYRVVVDEDEISGLSFVAFRRTATLFYVPAMSAAAVTRQMIVIDPADLDRALTADLAPG
ncbi:hypothetical protein E8L99_05960 [Phreatobacter aquaticus]|uniref:Uncharacterized protein n=1 Tax=Phreatobacter aquaticus TaxID=2570229 RepID=A0A4D7QJ14_9HYPH|nr:hypothetical protein [Phreatobacter aquaticus]QCK85346.1 hypothetical protein E8L99_05960 [Phreatobacter aquaticus]